MFMLGATGKISAEGDHNISIVANASPKDEYTGS